ncbi:MAG: hypothetical protein BGO10_07940 [Chlamydia sp. 32-24]|nr:MAG: hypothetical protein BGO10_07940 [Chlamydia sp. 32-24]
MIEIYKIKLSAQRALLGHVFNNLRAVAVDFKENTIYIYFFCDKNPSENEKDLCEDVFDEVIADFVHLDKIDFRIEVITVPYPQKMTLTGHWVYYRYEK